MTRHVFAVDIEQLEIFTEQMVFSDEQGTPLFLEVGERTICHVPPLFSQILNDVCHITDLNAF